MAIQDWTSVVVGSLQNLWIGAIGVLANIVGALVVFLIGLLIAAGVGALVERVVNLIRLDRALRSLGLQEYFDRAGIAINSGKFFGKLFYWFFVIVFLLAATDILGLYSLSNFLREVVLYLPNVIIAALIMLVSVMVANFLRHVVKASVKSAKLHAAHFLGALAWWAVVIFGFLAALSQLKIAVSIINALVTGFVAMLAIAGGIAFGLGGKDLAVSLLNRLRDRIESR